MPPSDKIQKKVIQLLKDIQEHLQSIDNLIGFELPENLKGIELLKFVHNRYTAALVEVKATKSCANDLRNTWPDGNYIWDILDSALDSTENLVKNGPRMYESAISNPPDLEEYKKLVQINRFWDAEQKKYFSEFSNLIPSWIRL